MLAIILPLFCLLPSALGHMEMSQPFPFKSKFDPANQASQDIDYSMTSPLAANGADFPCKGYQTALASSPVKATLTAGGSLEVTLSGSATHNGGSCEFSVSYDEGETWAVIQRYVGGCPLTPNFTVSIPKDLPAADKALFAWSWENHTGNREFYMNCAAVEIKNEDASVSSYTAPSLFRVNTLADGTCVTAEGIDIQYPHVNAVQTVFAGQMTASSPVTVVNNCPVELSKMVTVTSSGSSAGAAPDASSAASDAPGSAAGTGPGVVASSAQVPSSPAVAPPASSKQAIPSYLRSSVPASPAVPFAASQRPTQSLSSPAIKVAVPASSSVGRVEVCTGGSILCSSDGHGWSMCSNGVYLDMNGVEAGMLCRNGAFVRDPTFLKRRHHHHLKRLTYH